MQTREQIYAKSAFDQIDGSVKDKTDDYKRKYGTMAHKLPVLIRTAGLAQALQFVESRGSDEQRILLNHLANTIGFASKAEMLSQSRSDDISGYIYLTEKSLKALLWYKRFAQSVLKVEAADADDTVSGDDEQ